MSKWNEITVEEACEKVSVGIVVKPAQYYTTPDDGIKCFRSLNVGEGHVNDRDWVYITDEGNVKNKKSQLKEGDVLVVRSGAPGTSCVVTKEYEGCNCIDIVFARPKKNIINPEYLSMFTNSDYGKRHIFGTQGGLALKHFNVTAYKGLKIRIPDINTQGKIVENVKLWDAAIENIRKQILSKRINYDWLISNCINKSNFKKVHIATLAKEVSVRNGQNNIERVLSVTNKNGFVLPEEKFERRVASSDTTNYKIVKKKQYAYNPSRINVGSIARLEGWDEGILSPMYVVFELDEKVINTDYFLHWLSSHEAKQRIKNSAQGSVRETVSFSDLGSIYIPIAELQKQNEIAEILNTAKIEISLLEELLEKYIFQKRGVVQKLLSGGWDITEDREVA